MNLKIGLRNYLKGILITGFAVITTGLLMADPEDHTIHNNESVSSDTEMAAEFDASARGVSVSDGDTVVVKSSGTDLSYDITEIRAKAGSTITIRYENTSDMPHNIVLVKERSDIQPVGTAAIQARDNDYIPQNENLQDSMIAYTELAKPGYDVEVTFTVPPPGTYPYICTYPGHFTMMQGDLISQE